MKKLALATIAGFLTVIVAYSLLRLDDLLTKPQADPATILWSDRIAMFSRLSAGTYASGIVAIGVFFAASRDEARTAYALSWAVPLAAVIVAVQGLFFP